MDQHKHTAAVAALIDLIRSELDSTEPVQFSRVQRLAAMGQALKREGAKRAKDFAAAAGGMNVGGQLGGFMNGGGFGMACNDDDVDEAGGLARAVANYEGPADQAGLMRQLLQLLGDKNQNEAQLNAQTNRKSMAAELRELLAARKLAEGSVANLPLIATIDARITELQELMAKEDDNAHVVSAKPLRGHPARLGAPDQDQGDDPRPVPSREDRDRDAAEARHEVHGADQPVVHAQ
jgi:hypothetical protein